MYIFAFGLASPRVDMFLFSQGPQNMLSGTERFSYFSSAGPWLDAFSSHDYLEDGKQNRHMWRQLQVGLVTSTFARWASQITTVYPDSVLWCFTVQRPLWWFTPWRAAWYLLLAKVFIPDWQTFTGAVGSDVAEAGRGTQGTHISHLWTRKIIFKIAHLAGLC